MANRLPLNTPGKVVDNTFLLRMLELKNEISSQDFDEIARQTICCMVSVLAYSRWGVLRKGEPLVALLVASNCVYRFTLTRPENKAIGFMKTIDKAKDVATMEWMLSDYIEGYIRDFHDASSLSLNSKTQFVNPFDWTPLNFGSSDWIPVSQAYNFGFLFKTTSDEVIRVQRQYRLALMQGALSSGVKVVVKYVSAVLDFDIRSGIDAILSMLRMEAAVYKIAVSNAPERRSKPDSAPTYATAATPPFVNNLLGVKHPYMAILQDVRKSLIVMKDAGAPLTEVMQSPQFRQRWAQSRNLRRAFFSEVGLSALNFVDQLGLCHNDIRPPNIAVRGDSFCLLDFDFARSETVPNEESAFAPLLPLSLEDIDGLQTSLADLMCFSVAQIVLTVFMLSGPKVFGMDEVTSAVSIWKGERDASEIDMDFERWVRVKGGHLLDFILAFRGAAPWPKALEIDYKKYFTDVLSDMLD
jgi:serine/threonine protein kinase